ncbi:hypothetical protein PSTG_17898, partial [Puccinia striiformis f. sp. tritici PST-78]
MVVHEKLIEITKLLIEWDAKIVGVFEETPPQTGDDLLLPEWQEQIAQIMQTMQDNTFSNIPGDLHFQVVYPTGFDPDEERNDNDDNEDDSDQGEDQDQS